MVSCHLNAASYLKGEKNVFENKLWEHVKCECDIVIWKLWSVILGYNELGLYGFLPLVCSILFKRKQIFFEKILWEHVQCECDTVIFWAPVMMKQFRKCIKSRSCLHLSALNAFIFFTARSLLINWSCTASADNVIKTLETRDWGHISSKCKNKKSAQKLCALKPPPQGFSP